MENGSSHDHIACCVDDSETAHVVLAEAARLRDELGACRLSVLYVRAPGLNTGVFVAPATEEVDPAYEAWLVQLAEEAPDTRPVLLDGLMSHPPVEAVVWAEDNDVDLIVAASHHGAVLRAFRGSFAGYLARHASCPVMLIPPAALARASAPSASDRARPRLSAAPIRGGGA
jgi:nucleotide-binding universal stress UspA family protein